MKKILALIFLVCMLFSLTSCNFLLKPQYQDEPIVCTEHRDADDNGACDVCGDDFEDGSEIPEDEPTIDVPSIDVDEDEADEGDVHHYSTSLEIYKGSTSSLKESVLSELMVLEGALWESECDGVASVSDGVVSANGYGKTTLRVTDTDGNVCEIAVTVSVFVNQSGFSITPVSDDTVYKVYTEREANRLIDKAISEHKNQVILDFSTFGAGYLPYEDFNFKYEFGNHVSITKKYYENTPEKLYVVFKYNADAASNTTESTPTNTYESVTNANALLRLEAAWDADGVRADDFSDFPIYKSNNGTKRVQNSEELWLALEQNYLPVFTTKYTKAEKFFEEAKMILREIITDGMTDYEKVLAIFDYLVESVEYDYAALTSTSSSDAITNTCYYLEGVFERGRAVCDGKSKAFVLFCRIEGIECLRDYGSSRTGGVGHAWNYVKLDGKWYLVDTTNADSANAHSSDFGSFFGKNIEITVYDAFLTDVYYHYEKYEYTDIHKEVLTGAPADISASFINAAPRGKNYDFRIGNTIALTRLLTDLFSLGVDECVLLVTLPRDINIEKAVENASRAYGLSYEYEAYTGEMSGIKVGYIILKKTV